MKEGVCMGAAAIGKRAGIQQTGESRFKATEGDA